MKPTVILILVFWVAMLTYVCGCSGRSRESAQVNNTVQAIQQIISDGAYRQDPWWKECMLPGLQRGLWVLQNSQRTGSSLDKPELLTATVGLHLTQPTLVLGWIESGFTVHGVYIEMPDGGCSEFDDVFEWSDETRAILGTTPLRLGVGTKLLLDGAEKPVSELAGTKSIRLTSEQLLSGNVRVGLLYGDGQRTPAVDAYVFPPTASGTEEGDISDTGRLGKN